MHYSNLILGGLAAFSTSPSSAHAQSTATFNQTGPFLLKISTPTNDSLNGVYLSTCHAGAIIEGLCLGRHGVSNNTWNFFWNYTIIDGVPSDTGILTWTLPIVGSNILTLSEAMVLNYNPGSNVVLPLFMPGEGTPVGWDNSTLYIPGQYDDSLFKPNQYPESIAIAGKYNKIQLTNWYACWVYWGTYYFHALTWVSGGTPTNPTCEPVVVVREDINEATQVSVIPLPDVPKEPFDQDGGSGHDEHDNEDEQEDDHEDDDEDDAEDDDEDDYHEDGDKNDEDEGHEEGHGEQQSGLGEQWKHHEENLSEHESESMWDGLSDVENVHLQH